MKRASKAPLPRKSQGFASMTPERVRAIAAMGGKSHPREHHVAAGAKGAKEMWRRWRAARSAERERRKA